MSSQPSFFASLFDFSFSRFVTLRLVKFLYVVSMIVMVFAVIVLIVQSFTEAVSGVEAVGYIVLTPIFALLYLVGVRVGFELVVVVFRRPAQLTSTVPLTHLRPTSPPTRLPRVTRRYSLARQRPNKTPTGGRRLPRPCSS